MPPLAERVADAKAPREGRLNAVWALTRIDGPAVRKAVRPALADADLDVRLAAIHSAGLHRDVGALEDLIKLLAHADFAVRRQAATALGRIGKPDAVPPLLNALRDGAADRWLEHALIYALIQIADRDATRRGLSDASPAVQRGADRARSNGQRRPDP